MHRAAGGQARLQLSGDDARQDIYGGEAVQALTSELEKARGRTLVILAGYKEKLSRVFSAERSCVEINHWGGNS